MEEKIEAGEVRVGAWYVLYVGRFLKMNHFWSTCYCMIYFMVQILSRRVYRFCALWELSRVTLYLQQTMGTWCIIFSTLSGSLDHLLLRSPFSSVQHFLR